MTGIIVTGHGAFASGLTSSVKLIIGEPEKFIAIDFVQELTPEKLEEKLLLALEELKNCKNIIIFTDILGGTPFKISAKYVNERVKLITGTNLPMLIEASLSRQMSDNLVESVDATINSGRAQIQEFVLKEDNKEEDF